MNIQDIQTKKLNAPYSQGSEPGATSSRVGCYRARLRELSEKIPAECFDPCDRAFVGEIHRIIAEMAILPEECDVQIDGEKLPCGVVNEVYSELTVEHVRAIIKRFDDIREKIRYKKSYLRTALYNAVLEHASGEMNELRALGLEANKRTY